MAMLVLSTGRKTMGPTKGPQAIVLRKRPTAMLARLAPNGDDIGKRKGADAGVNPRE
jgi:hypothetical protein